MEALLLILILGVNLLLWSVIGGCRLVSDRFTSRLGRSRPPIPAQQRLGPADVAVLIPAHNEEPVIAASVHAASRLVAPGNVHVIADGCQDATAVVARSCGVHVLELHPGRGKAGGIEAAIERFALRQRFSVLLIADADTELDAHYLERGLPLLDDPAVVALAGYARTRWPPGELSPMGRLLVSYRTRLYAVMQWIKYGQTWRWTNVTAIVPGFASMYRTSILDRMDLNPPGLVIEDFHMTFEIHHRRLGRIAFRPSVHATAQDPDTLRDYYRQVLRWNLGFLQTLRRHRLWRSGFVAALLLFVAEIVVASVVIVVLGSWLVLSGVLALADQGLALAGWSLAPVAQIAGSFPVLLAVLPFLAVPDYLLTCVTAAALRRPSLLLYGLGFLFLRFVDATTMLAAVPMAWRTRSTGQWQSPTRRPLAASTAAPADGLDAVDRAPRSRTHDDGEHW